MLELFKARVRNGFRLDLFWRSRMRSLLRDINSDEEFEKKVLEEFDLYEQEGSAEKVQSVILHALRLNVKAMDEIFNAEEQSILETFKEARQFHDEVQNMTALKQRVLHDMPNFEDPSLGGALKQFFDKISALLEQDAELIRTSLLEVARPFRDQYDSLINSTNHKELKERLRDMVKSDVMTKLRENLNIRGARRAAKRLRNDFKAEGQAVWRLETLLKQYKLGKVSAKDVEAKMRELIGGLERQHKDFEEYFEDTRTYIFLTINHYFKVLEFLVDIELKEDQEEAAEFPEKDLAVQRKKTKAGISKEAKRAITVMREAYQALHDEEGDKTAAHRLAA